MERKIVSIKIIPIFEYKQALVELLHIVYELVEGLGRPFKPQLKRRRLIHDVLFKI